MSASANLIELRNVAKSYGALNVLRDVTLDIARGESLAIVGPSGSGKSTLLQIIGTLDRATTGEILLDGKNLAALDDLQLAAVRSKQIGFVFQSHYLLPQCSVLENVVVPTLACPKSEIRNPKSEMPEARAERLLKRVGLGERLHHRPGQLSGGERQRAAVVRALINRPQVLLADEPTGALDHASATALGQLLVELNREEGVTLVVVTHAMDLARRMGRVARIQDGKLIEDGR
jgi:predicted ABC-type transport system involved in lysophospholipase L1 biosynthesis ATPase subunit